MDASLIKYERPSISFFEKFSILNVVLTAVIALCVAAVGAYTSVRFAQAQQDGRIELIKSNVETLDTNQKNILKNIVPRAEHESHWQAEKDQLNSIHDDVREMRREQTELLKLMTQGTYR